MMHDDLERCIEQRMSEGRRFSIERIAPGNTYGERDTALVSAHATSELERHMSEMYDDIDASEAAAQPRDRVRDFGGLRTRRQWVKHLLEQLSMDIGRRRAFDFTVPSGSRVFAPPYDLEWFEGNALWPNLSSKNGDLYTSAKGEKTIGGFSAAGIGFYLTTDEPVLAAITPQGDYNFHVYAFENLPFVRSRGGMGITVYTDSEPNPTMSRQPVLWSVSGLTSHAAPPAPPWSGLHGSGKIADAASPAFGLGTVPLAPALVNMVPGSRYLVWVWCWQISRFEEDDAFGAFLGANIHGVTIEAGPPILLH